MNEAFSSGELENLNDSSFLLSKGVITQKVESVLKEVYNSLKNLIREWDLDPDITQISGKISKGEKYLELPYFVLDYPRIFGEDTFSLRIVVLWGRHIGTYFTVSGKYLDLVDLEKLMQLNNEIYVATSDSPWEHLIEESGYQRISDLDQEKVENLIKKNGFLKIAFRSNLNEIPDLKDRVLSNLKQLTLFVNLT